MKKLRRNLRVELISLPLLIIIFYALTPILSSSEHSAYFKDMFPVLLLQLVMMMFVKKIYVSKSAGLYLGLFLSALISTMFSDSVQMQRTIITYLLLCIMTILFACIQYSAKDIDCFITFYIIYGVVCAVLIVLSWVFHIEYQWNRYSIDIIGLHKNPNYINNIILLAFAFVLNRITQGKGRLVLNAFYCCIMCFGVFLTGTRAALLCILVLGVFTFVYICVIKRQYTYILILFLLAGGAYFLFTNYVPPVIVERLLGEDAFNDTGRLYMWGNAINEFMEQPILGMGLNGVTAYNRTISSVANIHNVLLQFLCDQGIIGAVILFTIIYSIWHRVKKEDRILVALMMIALYIPILFQNGTISFAFWWPLAVMEIFSHASLRGGINEKR